MIKEVFEKKRTVSDKFAEAAPHVISTAELYACLPLDVAIYCDIKTNPSEKKACWTALKSLTQTGQINSKLTRLSPSNVKNASSASDANTVYKEVRAMLK